MDNLGLIFTATPHEEGAWLTLNDAAGEKTSIRIKLMGVHSKRWRETKRLRDAQSQIYLKMMGMGKTEEAEEYQAGCLTEEGMMARVTLDWENMPDPDKAPEWIPLEFSEEKAAMIYRVAPKFLDQCDAFFSNALNFMQPSVKK